MNDNSLLEYCVKTLSNIEDDNKYEEIIYTVTE